jgi:Domain of unknown function (DUF5122) beta-propeller
MSKDEPTDRSVVKGSCYRRRVKALVVVTAFGFAALAIPSAGFAKTPRPADGKAAAAEVAAWGRNAAVKLPGMTVSGLAQDRGGRAIAVGFGNRGGTGHGIVVALRRDGSPDPSYGQNGYFLSSYLSTLGWDFAVPLPSGGLLIAGASRWGGTDSESLFALAELDARGRLVHGFADGGLYEATNASCLRGLRGITLQGRKILVAVVRECTDKDPEAIGLMRFNAAGSPDKNFGNSGTTPVTQLPWGSDGETPVRVVGNHILVATQAPTGGTVELIRFNADGSLDPSFGAGGSASTQVAVDSSAPPGLVATVSSLFLARAGRYTVAGCTRSGPFIVRFNKGGSPYRFWPGGPNLQVTNVEEFGGAFGSNGDSACASFAQLRDYKLAVAGSALFRLQPGGSLNPFQAMLVLPYFDYYAGQRQMLVTRDGAVIVATNPVDNGPAIISAYHF